MVSRFPKGKVLVGAFLAITAAGLSGVALANAADVLEAKIHEVQGRGAESPLVGTRVLIEGIVTGDFVSGLKGFFLQEPNVDQDADPATSEGVFVFCDACREPVKVGDRATVVGVVVERNGLTGLAGVSVSVLDDKNELPSEAVIKDIAGTDLESLEGMRVRLTGPLTVVSNYNLQFGELGVTDRGILMQPTQVRAPGPEAYTQMHANSASIILLDDGDLARNPDPVVHATGGGPLTSAATVRSGDVINDVSAVLSFGFGAYRLQPTSAVVISAANPRQRLQPNVGGNFRVAAFNVLNYFTTLDARGADTAEEFERQRAKLTQTISTMDVDVIGLVEVENDLAGVPDQAVKDIVDAVNALGDAGSWALVPTGAIGTDQIKVAFIYRPNRVAPVGVHALLDSSVDSRFDDTKSRPALAQRFKSLGSGQNVTVIVTHLKSKGSACAGDPDVKDGQGNCNLTRIAAAEALIDWVRRDPAGAGNPDVLIIGDLNSYAKEDPIRALENAGFTNLEARFNPDAYGYTFNGQRGTLDYGFASSCLASRATGAAAWHINADEPSLLDYNLDNGRDPALFDAAIPFRTSDHDPLLMGFDLQGQALCNSPVGSDDSGRAATPFGLSRSIKSGDGV